MAAGRSQARTVQELVSTHNALHVKSVCTRGWLTSKCRNPVLMPESVNICEIHKEMLVAMEEEPLSKIVKDCVFKLG